MTVKEGVSPDTWTWSPNAKRIKLALWGGGGGCGTWGVASAKQHRKQQQGGGNQVV